MHFWTHEVWLRLANFSEKLVLWKPDLEKRREIAIVAQSTPLLSRPLPLNYICKNATIGATRCRLGCWYAGGGTEHQTSCHSTIVCLRQRYLATGATKDRPWDKQPPQADIRRLYHQETDYCVRHTHLRWTHTLLTVHILVYLRFVIYHAFFVAVFPLLFSCVSMFLVVPTMRYSLKFCYLKKYGSLFLRHTQCRSKNRKHGWCVFQFLECTLNI